jgi:uncharacterized membrane protein
MSYVRCSAVSFPVTGLVFGLGFFPVSLTPSLLPRVFAVQGILAGLVFAAGYGIGPAGYRLWKVLELKDIPARCAGIVGWLFFSALTLVAVLTLGRMTAWQNSVVVGRVFEE